MPSRACGSSPPIYQILPHPRRHQNPTVISYFYQTLASPARIGGLTSPGPPNPDISMMYLGPGVRRIRISKSRRGSLGTHTHTHAGWLGEAPEDGWPHGELRGSRLGGVGLNRRLQLPRRSPRARKGPATAISDLTAPANPAIPVPSPSIKKAEITSDIV